MGVGRKSSSRTTLVNVRGRQKGWYNVILHLPEFIVCNFGVLPVKTCHLIGLLLMVFIDILKAKINIAYTQAPRFVTLNNV